MVEIDKEIILTTEVTLTKNLKWISGEVEPSTPEGYERSPDLDIDVGVLGKLWGFMEVN